MNSRLTPSRRRLACLLAVMTGASLTGVAVQPAGAGTVVMSSPFSGTALDANWVTAPSKGCDQPSNAWVSGGQLHLIVGTSFCGARLQSTGTFTQGVTITVRMKAHLPYGSHMGVTLYGTKAKWPFGGEMDAAELTGRWPTVDHVRLWSNYEGVSTISRCGIPYDYHNATSLDGQWHIYRTVWTKRGVTFYEDSNVAGDISYAALKALGCTNPFADPTNPFRIFLTAGAGGKWAGDPRGQPGYPATLDIDYVRVARP